jgi:hypothetical protein
MKFSPGRRGRHRGVQDSPAPVPRYGLEPTMGRAGNALQRMDSVMQTQERLPRSSHFAAFGGAHTFMPAR